MITIVVTAEAITREHWRYFKLATDNVACTLKDYTYTMWEPKNLGSVAMPFASLIVSVEIIALVLSGIIHSIDMIGFFSIWFGLMSFSIFFDITTLLKCIYNPCWVFYIWNSFFLKLNYDSTFSQESNFASKSNTFPNF